MRKIGFLALSLDQQGEGGQETMNTATPCCLCRWELRDVIVMTGASDHLAFEKRLRPG